MGVFETVEDVERVYTSSEVKMAREAKELFARMAFPSIKGLISLLRKGKIRNFKVTPVCQQGHVPRYCGSTYALYHGNPFVFQESDFFGESPQQSHC